MRNIITFIFALLLVSCRTHTEYVPLYHTNYMTQWAHDTIEVRDTFINDVTTIVRELDSVELAAYGIKYEKERKGWLVERDKYQKELSRNRIVKTDSVIVVDSIEKPVYIEKGLSSLQKFKINGFGVLLFTNILFMLFIITNKIRR